MRSDEHQCVFTDWTGLDWNLAAWYYYSCILDTQILYDVCAEHRLRSPTIVIDMPNCLLETELQGVLQQWEPPS